ncbi:MAG: hypothetical protein VX583_06315 [Bdellovibrionota bacterium]
MSTRVPHEAEGVGGLSEAWTMLFRQALVDHLQDELKDQIRQKTNPTKSKKKENPIQEKKEPKIGERTLSTQVPHEAEGAGGLSEAWTMLFCQALVDHLPKELNIQIRQKQNPQKAKKRKPHTRKDRTKDW